MMLVAAAQVFCEKGFVAAGVDEIAACVGLKKPRLYFILTERLTY